MNPADIPFWITATHWASRSVLVILILLSLWSVATMIQCYRVLRQAAGGNNRTDIFNRVQDFVRAGKFAEASSDQNPSLYKEVIRTAAATQVQEPARIDRNVKCLLILKRTEIEQGLTILATLGSNAPFIGLFGTVLGIIQSFGALGASGSGGGGSTVMVGISEALVATAVGLFVAIPAVIAFNFLSRSMRVLMTNCEALRDLYIAQLKAD